MFSWFFSPKKAVLINKDEDIEHSLGTYHLLCCGSLYYPGGLEHHTADCWFIKRINYSIIEKAVDDAWEKNR